MPAAIPALHVPHQAVADVCRRWGIVKMELFGSALRPDFDPARSDVDLMVTFAPDRLPGWEFFADLPEELSAIFGRKVDVLTRRSVEQSQNEYRRREILENSVVIYEV
ncbi:MAG TPA: nucleotidyltransferase domain-containing protein [Chthoniobacteraceae bacterium]|jgi:predicted nucleotidyltransferase|nr:nucleotidyltransferase domain-containing protein [Chthoniobacteraceae bacterium]